ncbi:hypothetical protein VB712_13795 [Spirulina sp. CCNP1310]|uniref:hypothetical protein n=1 Tax=Spirulina sp. CCNP1310 TaxID=3110249 RepID=UPI002B1EE6ED|nr:hypothetical protein [Spirulina sp. CCNP1310]MEA5420299.1 hypothetical protein [Spirulina sp. CCNP1310]
MSLTAEQFDDHVESIMLSSRARGKAVILCEGDTDSVKNVGRNPSMYKQLEKIPDANFYKACLPKEARRRRAPVFFPCGSRADVIKVFFELHKLVALGKASYVDVNKLFAIVDLDIQKQKLIIENENDQFTDAQVIYPFSDTEEIFLNLYNGLEINHVSKEQHKIFVTGLIHKEAYFLLPELKEFFNDYKHPILYQDNALDLWALYDEILRESSADQDLNKNLESVLKRMSFLDLNCPTVSELCHSLESKYKNTDKLEFARIIFLFRKAKPYWEKIITDFKLNPEQDNEEQSKEQVERFREQLSLEIAKFYSRKDDNNFHLTAIFKSIYKQAYGIEL